VFEAGLHGTHYADLEVTTPDGEWITPVINPTAEDPLVFVAMPHTRDKWITATFIVTPLSP
jgi:hypothetical protein